MGNTIIKRITYEEEISEQLEANLAEMELIQKAVLSLEDRNEQECLRCRYIDVIEDEEGNRKRLTGGTWHYGYTGETMKMLSVPQHASIKGRWRA